MELGIRGKKRDCYRRGFQHRPGDRSRLRAEGCNLTIAELSVSHGELVAAEVKAQGAEGKVKVIESDVIDHQLVDSMIEQSGAEFGGVDVLVNNVGWTVDRLFMDKPREEFEKEVQVNLWGAINCVHAVLPHMIDRGSGSIVCLSSDAGRMGEYREAVYSACKAGGIALSKSIARETGRHGLRVNVVCPGLVVPPDGESISGESMWNQMRDIFTGDVQERARRAYPLRRLATAREVANAVVFLASDAASFITGQTLSVSGGYTMMKRRRLS